MDSWWFAYLLVTVPVAIIAAAAIAVAIWANGLETVDDDQETHLPAE